MSDLIDRQAAIDKIIDLQEWYSETFHEPNPPTGALISAVEGLPSARKTGKWIDYTEDGYVECPFCHSATNCDGNKEELHFCFSCGADMRGEE